MKLIHCIRCRDVFKPQYDEVRHCLCGNVAARYRTVDTVEVAVVDKTCGFVPLAMLNTELGIAAERFSHSPCWWPVAVCTMPWDTVTMPRSKEPPAVKRRRQLVGKQGQKAKGQP